MKRICALAAFAVTIAAPASAAEFDFTYSRAGVTASGIFTTTDAAGPNGFLVITALSGTRNGMAMTLLAPGTFPASFPNDNLIRDAAPQLTFSGISFTTDQAYNVFFDTAYFECFANCGNLGTDAIQLSSFTATRRTAGAVPEPATWAMMIGGFGLVGGAMRARRRREPVTA